MTALAEILAFKFPGVEGIRTREKASHPEPFDAFRDMEIFDWPAGAGQPKPTRAQLAAWRTQFEALPVEKPEATLADVWEAIKAKTTITDADLPSDRQPPRRP